MDNPSDATAYNVNITDDLQNYFELFSNATVHYPNGSTGTYGPSPWPQPGGLVYWNISVDLLPGEGVNISYLARVKNKSCCCNLATFSATDGNGTSLDSYWVAYCTCPYEPLLKIEKESVGLTVTTPKDNATAPTSFGFRMVQYKNMKNMKMAYLTENQGLGGFTLIIEIAFLITRTVSLMGILQYTLLMERKLKQEFIKKVS